MVSIRLNVVGIRLNVAESGVDRLSTVASMDMLSNEATDTLHLDDIATICSSMNVALTNIIRIRS